MRPGAALLPPVPFDTHTLAQTRQLVRRAATVAGLDEAASQVLVTAVNEALINAIDHGGSRRTLSIMVTDGTLRAEIIDSGTAGPLRIPRQPPSPDAARGRGLWIMSQVARVQLDSEPGRTAVIIEMPLDTNTDQ